MDKYLGQEYPEVERARFLKDNCDNVEPFGYTRNFTQEEMDAMKDNLAEVSIELDQLSIEKKEVVAEIKSKIKPKERVKADLLTKIREKSEFVKEDCFKFIDQEAGKVGYYNSEGVLVYERGIKPDERQTRMFALKTGTNS